MQSQEHQDASLQGRGKRKKLLPAILKPDGVWQSQGMSRLEFVVITRNSSKFE